MNTYNVVVSITTTVCLDAKNGDDAIDKINRRLSQCEQFPPQTNPHHHPKAHRRQQNLFLLFAGILFRAAGHPLRRTGRSRQPPRIPAIL